MQGPCNGSRRRFLQTSAAAGAALAAADQVTGAPQQGAPESSIPQVTLGGTGQKVTKLGMGSSWSIDPGFVQKALALGVRYIDTSESYENRRAEQVIGQVLDRTGFRKDVYLVSKTTRYRGVADPVPVFLSEIEGSLERLQTDYLDCYYIHGISGDYLKMLKDPAVKGVFERLKSEGKIKFAGFSCHDPYLPELLETAADVGWIDQVMIQYNFRFTNRRRRGGPAQDSDPVAVRTFHDKLQRAVDKASAANIAMVAMKTQGGAEAVLSAVDNEQELFKADQTLKRMKEEGVKKQVAALKAAWADERMHVVVSEMTTTRQLAENIGASKEPLTVKEARLLEEHRQQTENLFCHGCGHLCESPANGVPVAKVMRYLRYYSAYGKRQAARELYQALPAEARNVARADLEAAERACPHGLPVVKLMTIADRHLS